MTKPFQTTHQQLAILNKRGLTIPDYKRAKQYLLTNNYYNTINGYSKYFFQTPNKYQKGATFDEITYARLFDNEIKYTFLKAILEAENHIASIFAYTFAEFHKNDPDFYLDFASYQPPKRYKDKLTYTLNQLQKLLARHHKKKTSTPINHYQKNHSHVPFWVIINFLTFGEVVTLIRLAPISVQNKVAMRFYSFIKQHYHITSKFTPAIFVSFIENIAEVRNICAHDNRLWDFKCRDSVKYYPVIHDAYGIINQQAKSDVYNVYIILQCFISAHKYDILTKTLKKRFKNFENKLHSQSINIFLNSLGFPNDWHLQEPLK